MLFCEALFFSVSRLTEDFAPIYSFYSSLCSYFSFCFSLSNYSSCKCFQLNIFYLLLISWLRNSFMVSWCLSINLVSDPMPKSYALITSSVGHYSKIVRFSLPAWPYIYHEVTFLSAFSAAGSGTFIGLGSRGGYLTVGGTISLNGVAGLYAGPFFTYFCLGGIYLIM